MHVIIKSICQIFYGWLKLRSERREDHNWDKKEIYVLLPWDEILFLLFLFVNLLE